jgi:hypothetical protein
MGAPLQPFMRHRREQFRRGTPRDCGSLAGRDLLDACALVSGGVAQQGRKPTLWAAATSLAECAPLVVVGSPEHQTELSALLAAGDVDLVVCSESSLQVAVGLVERRLRQRHLRTTSEAASRHVQENHMESQQATRDFGEVLRPELNNPLTGILR